MFGYSELFVFLTTFAICALVSRLLVRRKVAIVDQVSDCVHATSQQVSDQEVEKEINEFYDNPNINQTVWRKINYVIGQVDDLNPDFINLDELKIKVRILMSLYCSSQFDNIDHMLEEINALCDPMYIESLAAQKLACRLYKIYTATSNRLNAENLSDEDKRDIMHKTLFNLNHINSVKYTHHELQQIKKGNMVEMPPLDEQVNNVMQYLIINLVTRVELVLYTMNSELIDCDFLSMAEEVMSNFGSDDDWTHVIIMRDNRKKSQ